MKLNLALSKGSALYQNIQRVGNVSHPQNEIHVVSQSNLGQLRPKDLRLSHQHKRSYLEKTSKTAHLLRFIFLRIHCFSRSERSVRASILLTAWSSIWVSEPNLTSMGWPTEHLVKSKTHGQHPLWSKITEQKSIP